MQRKRKASETRALKQIRKPAVRAHRAAEAAGRPQFPTQCMRELDVEPTGAPYEDVCLGKIDPRTGRCQTCDAEARP